MDIENIHGVVLPIKFLFFALFFLLHSLASAASSENFRFKILNVADGLPHDTVQVVMQAKNGFIWVGTSVGLARYDGYNFKIFKATPDSKGLTHNSVTSIVEDQLGNLWIGTMGGLNYFDPQSEKFKNFKHDDNNYTSLSHDYVWRLFIDKKQQLWIATMGGGLNRYEGDGKFNRYTSSDEKPNSISSKYISDIKQDQSGFIWVATHKGLNRIDITSKSIVSFSNKKTGNRKLLKDGLWALYNQGNTLLLGTTEGLVKYDKKQGIFESIKLIINGKIVEPEITSISSEDGVRFWLGTKGDGLIHFNSNSHISKIYQRNENKSSLVDNSIRHLFIDQQKNLWISTNGSGISILNPLFNEFSFIRNRPYSNHNLKSDVIISFSETKQGNLLIGTSKGLNLFNKSSNTISPIIDIEESQIWEILRDGDDTYWLGTDSGLILYNLRTNQLEAFKPTETNDLLVTNIVNDNSGRLWLGTDLGLFSFRIEDNTFKRHSPIELGLARDLVIDVNNKLWMRNNDGLALFDLNTNKLIQTSAFESLLAKNFGKDITEIYQDTHTNIWVGTYGSGLTKTNAKFEILAEYSTDNLLLNNNIYSIEEDNSGNLWFGTEEGVTKLSDEPKLATHFNYIDGLPSIQFVLGKAYKSNNGNLFFPFTNGFTEFSPRELIAKPSAVSLHITDVLIDAMPIERVVTRGLPVVFPPDNNIPISENKMEEVVVDYTVNSLTLKFAALDYSFPYKQKYEYKLEGFDKTWVISDYRERIASYGKLPSGSYVFTVKSIGFNSLETKLKIIVQPAPWRTWWAYLIYTLLTVFFFSRYHNNQKIKVESTIRLNKELELRVEERTQQLEKANQQLKEFSFTDQLTGLKNRRFIENNIGVDIELISRRSVTENRRSPEDLIYFMIDIDYFKRINDTYGHAAGDLVLKDFALLLNQVFRTTDYLVRWGGEEFLVVSRFIPKERASMLAERLRKSVEEYKFKITDCNTLSVTCSIGFTYHPKNHHKITSWTEVVELTDCCLYAAKRSARNAWVGIDSIGYEVDINEVRTGSLEQDVKSGKVKVLTSLPDHESLLWS
ncbi:ligand-binding sensor domain-containing diguanylate cyclase [Colwellia piezophila]|uniref:ligand-binding sensor domain-containing diguanylate cyclase n=1 Tax=Colwellia piezophila TaxID=211668 RepID=UPI0003796CF4|nr:ligand-binding sensor domain-containing diguanylate cyclase [Colwellia piezophila]